MFFTITIITVIIITVIAGMFCAASFYSSLFIKRDYNYATISVVMGVACLFFLICELKLLTMI